MSVFDRSNTHSKVRNPDDQIYNSSQPHSFDEAQDDSALRQHTKKLFLSETSCCSFLYKALFYTQMSNYSLCILFLFPLCLYGQVNPGPRITALGTTGVALQDVWSLQSNQAGLAAVRKPIASAAYKSEFLNPDLSTQSVVIAIPYKKNVFGISFQNYGFAVYNEQRIGFAYAKNFGNTVFASLNFNYHQLKIQQYGSANAYSVEVGLQYLPTDKLVIGGHITNPGLSNYEYDVTATIPVSIEFGISYRFTNRLLLNNGIIKTLNSTTDLRTGLEYSMNQWLDFRGGFSMNPFRQYAGFGCKYNGFHIDMAVSTHSSLGSSPQIAISYEF
jgi:hypothetical protein